MQLLPLERDLARLAALTGTEFVLLGSVATGKYLDVLLDVVGERLLFPTDFVGRGDMSRGALLLKAARETPSSPTSRPRMWCARTEPGADQMKGKDKLSEYRRKRDFRRRRSRAGGSSRAEARWPS